jgi:hypothetical protein
VALVALGLVGCTIGGVLWLRSNIVPPDCADPRTLALVRQSLIANFKLPDSLTVRDIETLAGGYLAFRFACKAQLGGFDPQSLPAGPIPGSVEYISRLSADHQRHEVSVAVQPLLKLERVQ